MKECKASKWVGIYCLKTEGCALKEFVNRLNPDSCREAIRDYEQEPRGSGIDGCVEQQEILRILRERANG